MAIVINGSGTVTGLAVGGLPDATVDSGTLASGIDKTSITDGGNATAMTIDSSEQVGIGQAPTDYQLVVREPNGDKKVLELSTGDSTCRLAFSRAGDPAAYIDMKEDGATGTGGLHFGTGTSNTPTTTLKLTSDGRAKSDFTVAAWAQYKGTSTNAIRDSFNISSVTDNGTGDYTFNFSNNMTNEYYSAVGTANEDGTTGYKTVYIDRAAAPAVGAVRLQSINSDGSYTDASTMCMQVTGGTI